MLFLFKNSVAITHSHTHLSPHFCLPPLLSLVQAIYKPRSTHVTSPLRLLIYLFASVMPHKLNQSHTSTLLPSHSVLYTVKIKTSIFEFPDKSETLYRSVVVNSTQQHTHHNLSFFANLQPVLHWLLPLLPSSFYHQCEGRTTRVPLNRKSHR